MIKQYLSPSTGAKVRCVQWLGDNLEEIKAFCLTQNVMTDGDYEGETKAEGIIWIRVVKITDKVPVPHFQELRMGEWIMWNELELYALPEDFAKTMGYIELNKKGQIS